VDCYPAVIILPDVLLFETQSYVLANEPALWTVRTSSGHTARQDVNFTLSTETGQGVITPELVLMPHGHNHASFEVVYPHVETTSTASSVTYYSVEINLQDDGDQFNAPTFTVGPVVILKQIYVSGNVLVGADGSGSFDVSLSEEPSAYSSYVNVVIGPTSPRITGLPGSITFFRGGSTTQTLSFNVAVAGVIPFEDEKVDLHPDNDDEYQGCNVFIVNPNYPYESTTPYEV